MSQQGRDFLPVRPASPCFSLPQEDYTCEWTAAELDFCGRERQCAAVRRAGMMQRVFFGAVGRA